MNRTMIARELVAIARHLMRKWGSDEDLNRYSKLNKKIADSLKLWSGGTSINLREPEVTFKMRNVYQDPSTATEDDVRTALKKNKIEVTHHEKKGSWDVFKGKDDDGVVMIFEVELSHNPF